MENEDPFAKDKFYDEKSFISFLKDTDGSFEFTNCDFSLPGDLGSLLVNLGVPGIVASPLDIDGGTIGWITGGLFISNVCFQSPVSFTLCNFSGPVYFNNVVFEKGCTFFESDFGNEVNFVNVEFIGAFQFRSVKVKRHVSFVKCLINAAQTGFHAGEYEDGLSFFDTEINNGIDLSNSKIKDVLLLRECVVSGKLELWSCKLDSFQLIGSTKTDEPAIFTSVSLKTASISGQVQLNRITVQEEFIADWATFNAGVFIDRSLFQGNCLWMHCTFSKLINIEKTVFENDLNLADANFQDRLAIRRSDYKNSRLYFNGAKFQNSLTLGTNLTHNKRSSFKGCISFQGAIFESGTIIRIFGVNKLNDAGGEIDFSNSLIKGLLDIREVYLATLSFSGAIVTGNIQENGSILPAIKDANSARILKHEARKINSHLSALNYYQKEMVIYSKTLNWSHGDWWLLNLNRISNNFGLNWLRGVLFTVLSGLVCYTIFESQLISYDSSFFLKESFWAGFLNYFWLPTGLNELVSSANPVHINGGVIGSIFFILGKIAIAYGIYQTVAAFRKHVQ